MKLPHTSGLMTMAGRVASMLELGQKLPPGVTFLFFYGAIAALGVAGALLWGQRVEVAARWSQPLWDWLAMLGRNSLLAFVLQFYVYYTAVHLLPKPPLWMAPLYFTLTVAVLSAAIAACDRFSLNRLFSVGFARVARTLRERRSARISAPGERPPSPLEAPPHERTASRSVVEPRQ